MKIDRFIDGISITDISFLEQSTLVARKLNSIIRIQVLVKFYTFLESPSSSSGFLEAAATWAKYEITFLVFSVLPAPDSPLY